MSIKDVYIRRLWDLGHFHNPARATGVNLADLPTLDLHDDEVQEAVKSFQEMMKPTLQEATFAHFARVDALIDGEIGPATADVFATPRCGFPDYAVPERAMGLAGGPLEANWPTACRQKLRFGRNYKSLPGLNETDTHSVFWASCNNWWTALANFDMQPAAVGDTNVHVYCDLGALAGSTLAWSYLATNNCSDRLAQRFNTRTNWANKAFAATVKTHEDGHALGLNHNNDGSALMYPAINSSSQSRAGYPNATDLRTAQSIGYTLSGNPAPPREKLFLARPWDAPTDPTDPEPPTGIIRVDGILTVMQGDKPLRRFTLTPYTEA